jgi:hypothetical protein
VLIDMIDPRHRNEVMVLAVGRTLFGQLDLVGTLEVIDLPDRLFVRGYNVHMFLDQRGISHVCTPEKRMEKGKCAITG